MVELGILLSLYQRNVRIIYVHGDKLVEKTIVYN